MSILYEKFRTTKQERIRLACAMEAFFQEKESPGACLKNHSCNLHAPFCGTFIPNSVVVARYDALIRDKSPTNCDAHLAESIFQTRSREKELEDYRLYLKKRIRPAMEILIKSEDTIKMEKLEKQGWFGKKELEQFILLAREQQKLESLVWLMRLKDRKYGYEERKFII